MSQQPKRSTLLGLEGGLFQAAMLAVTALLGVFLAYQTAGWFTLFGAAAGIALVKLARWMPINKISPRLSGWAAPLLGFLPRLAAGAGIVMGWLLGVSRGRAAQAAARRMWRLYSRLSQFVRREDEPSARTILVCGVLKSPLYYLRWGVLGWMMGIIIQHVVNKGAPVEQIPWHLDLAIGGLILLSALRDVLNDISRRAMREAQDALPEAVSRSLLSVRRIGGMTEAASEGRLSDLREAVRSRSWQIGSYFSNGAVFLESIYNLAIVLAVLMAISRLGALLAFAAVAAIAAMIVRDLAGQHEDEEPLRVMHARLRSLHSLARDPRTERLRNALSGGAYAGAVEKLSGEIHAVKQAAREEGRGRRAVARVVFFTLFAMSALFPLMEAYNGEMRPRVALLYTFSLIGLWAAVSAAAERAAWLVEGMDGLEEVEEVLDVIAAAAQAPAPAPREVTSSGIEFKEVRFGYPFKPLLLRWPQEFTVRATISTAEVVKVIGPARGGTSTLLKLLVGDLSPSSGSILIGGVTPADLSPETRRETLIYIADDPRPFPTIKLRELFRTFCGEGYSDAEVREVLRKFELLDELEEDGREEWTGPNLLLEFGEIRLDDRQTRLLWLGLHYAAMAVRLHDHGFQPAVIAVDGVHKLADLAARRQVMRLFKDLAGEFHATLAMAARHQGDLEDSDQVLTIVPPAELPPDFALEDSPASVVFGGSHGARWQHGDRLKRDRYRNYLKGLSERL